MYRMHTTGYGMAPGFPPSWGEGPSVFGGSRDILQAGMVVSVEPNVFLMHEGLGARLIDNVVITETGCELLSVTPQEIAVSILAQYVQKRAEHCARSLSPQRRP